MSAFTVAEYKQALLELLLKKLLPNSEILRHIGSQFPTCHIFQSLMRKCIYSTHKSLHRTLSFFFAQYFYSFYIFTGVIKQNIHTFSQVTMSFSNFTHYTHNNRDI